MTTIRILYISALIALAASATTFGKAVDSASQREAQMLFNQALDHGDTWRKGVVEITYNEHSPTICVSSAFLAFDRDQGMMRYDCEMTLPENTWSCKKVVTPQEIMLWTSGNGNLGTVNRYNPDDGPNVPDAQPYDVNAIAMADANSVVNNYDLLELRDFYTRLYPFEADRVVEYERRGSMVEATWELGAPQGFDSRELKQLIVFDIKSGGLPVRSMVWSRRPNTTDWEEYARTTIEWQPVANNWVPKTFRSKNTIGSAADVELIFSWKSLNDDVPENLFSIEGLEVDPRSLVMNMKLGPRVIEGTMQEVLHPPDDRAVLEIGGGTRYWLVAINALLLALIVTLVVWRYRRSSTR